MNLRYTSFILLLCLVCVFFLSSSSAFGQFTDKKILDFTFTFAHSVEAADVDGDGDQDIITYANDRGLVWAGNDGQGNFSGNYTLLPASHIFGYLNGINSLNYKAFDYDKDGDQDLAVVSGFTQKLYIWENGGSGAFNNPQIIASNLEYANSLTIKDFDSDNDADIVVAILSGNSSMIFMNDRNARSWVQKDFFPNAAYFEITDIDKNGSLDVIAISSTNRSIYLNKKIIAEGFSETHFLKILDVDRDGDLDIVAANQGYDNGIVWLEQSGSLFISHTLPTTIGTWYTSVCMFDFDGDGDEDIFGGCWNGCGINLYENKGLGIFSSAKEMVGGGIYKNEMIFSDLNGDESSDIIYVSASNHAVNAKINGITPFAGIESGFTSEKTCINDTILFKQNARGRNIVSWSWDFGDMKGKSSQRNPGYLYSHPGDYQVSLKVTNDKGQSHTTTQTVKVRSLPSPLPDQTFSVCGYNDFLITLDKDYHYAWYYSLTDKVPIDTNSFHKVNKGYQTVTLYLQRIDSWKCSSEARSKITVNWYDYPSSPSVTGAISYNGAAELILKANAGSNKTQWFKQNDTIPFYEGNEYKRVFSESTSLYVRSVNQVGCASAKIPVTATVYSAPIPSPRYVWADATNSKALTEGLSIAKDTKNNIYVLGTWTNNKLIVGADTIEAGAHFGNRFLIKYDPNGKAIQTRKIAWGEDMSFLRYEHILVDSKNNIYLSGQLTGSIQIGSAKIVPPDLNKRFGLLVKMDSLGSLLWYKLYENGSKPKMVIDQSDNVLFSDIFSGTIPELNVSTAPNKIDYYLVKYDEMGKVKWANSFSNIQDLDMASDSNGSIYISGLSEGTVSFGSIKVVIAKQVGTAAIMAKYSDSGKELWAKQITTIGYALAPKIKVDSDNAIIVAGEFIGNILFEGTNVLAGSGGNIFLAKYQPDGQNSWVKSLRCDGQNWINDLTIDEQANIYIVGTYYKKMNFDGYILERNLSDWVAFASKYDKDGHIQWARDMNQRDFNGSVADEWGNLFITGSFKDSVQLDDIALLGFQMPQPASNYNVLTTKLGLSFAADFRSQVACVTQATQFTDWSTAKDMGRIVGWEWTFGDGKTSIEKNPTHIFSVTGKYAVTLKVTNSAGAHISTTKEVTIENPISFAIQPANTEQNAKGNALFSVKVTGNPVRYQWRKNQQELLSSSTVWGVNTSSLTLTDLQVSDAGKYDCLIYGSCNSILSQEVTLKVNDPASLGVDFRYQVACATQATQFTDSSIAKDTDRIVSWEWNFGDGKTSNEKNPIHIFSAPGKYAVNLKVANSAGSHAAISKNISILNAISFAIQPESKEQNTQSNAVFSVKINGIAVRYQWRKNQQELANSSTISGANSSTLALTNLQVSDAGKYDCVVADSCHSIVSNEVSLKVNLLTGLEAPTTGFNIYPNPSNGYLKIASESTIAGPFTLEIFSLLGTKVLKKTFNSLSSPIELDISFLPAGSYHVICKGKHAQLNKHLILTH